MSERSTQADQGRYTEKAFMPNIVHDAVTKEDLETLTILTL
jgi:hypothetical protein